jgi:hypothetical protein
VVRKLLDSATGYIDLAKEKGHALDFANEEDGADNDEDADLLRLWAKQTGESTD